MKIVLLFISGLFHRAISQSGGATAPWATKLTDSLKQAQRFASNIKCPTSNTKEMVKCLKEASPEQIQEGHKESTVCQNFFSIDIIAFISSHILLFSKKLNNVNFCLSLVKLQGINHTFRPYN